MIAIIDCESGATEQVRGILTDLGADAQIVSAAEAIGRASKIVLPSTHSFPDMIRSIRDRGFVAPLLHAINEGRPVLGISHGMHLLMDVSYEDGQHTGLGAIHGKATHFDFGEHPAAKHFVVPHQGWNQVNWTDGCPLLAGLNSGEYFYFDHMNHAEPLDRQFITAECNHGIDFAAVLWNRNVFGTQFLPERSEDAGRKLLINFLGT